MPDLESSVKPTTSPADGFLRAAALIALVLMAFMWVMGYFKPLPGDGEFAELSSYMDAAINNGMTLGVPVMLVVLWITGLPTCREVVAAAVSVLAGGGIFLAAALAADFAGWSPLWPLVALFLVAIPFSQWIFRRIALPELDSGSRTVDEDEL